MRNQQIFCLGHRSFAGSDPGGHAFHGPMVALLLFASVVAFALLSFLPLAGREARGAIRQAVPG
jgi:hypothetical protein